LVCQDLMEQVLGVWGPGPEEDSGFALRGLVRQPDIMGRALYTGSGGAVFPGEEAEDVPGVADEDGGEGATAYGARDITRRHPIMAVLPIMVPLPMPSPRRRRSERFWRNSKGFSRTRSMHSETGSTN
jgi:hypothetical protein